MDDPIWFGVGISFALAPLALAVMAGACGVASVMFIVQIIRRRVALLPTLGPLVWSLFISGGYVWLGLRMESYGYLTVASVAAVGVVVYMISDR